MDRPYEHITFRDQDGIFCVRIKNHRLQEENLEQLGTELSRLIDEHDCRKMVLSLGPRDFECLYSVFLGKLIHLQRRLATVDGVLVLAEASENTQGVFRATGLDKHFQFFADPLTAVHALA
jgi:anti-anti-sigma factor